MATMTFEGELGTEPDFPDALNKEKKYAKAGANQTWWTAASYYPARQ
jgi:hypothetical protein